MSIRNKPAKWPQPTVTSITKGSQSWQVTGADYRHIILQWGSCNLSTPYTLALAVVVVMVVNTFGMKHNHLGCKAVSVWLPGCQGWGHSNNQWTVWALEEVLSLGSASNACFNFFFYQKKKKRTFMISPFLPTHFHPRSIHIQTQNTPKEVADNVTKFQWNPFCSKARLLEQEEWTHKFLGTRKYFQPLPHTHTLTCTILRSMIATLLSALKAAVASATVWMERAGGTAECLGGPSCRRMP